MNKIVNSHKMKNKKITNYTALPKTFAEFMSYAENTSNNFTSMLKNGIKHFYPDLYSELRMDTNTYTAVELVAALKALGIDFQESKIK